MDRHQLHALMSEKPYHPYTLGELIDLTRCNRKDLEPLLAILCRDGMLTQEFIQDKGRAQAQAWRVYR